MYGSKSLFANQKNKKCEYMTTKKVQMIITRYLCDDHEIRGRQEGGEGRRGCREDPGVATLVTIYQGMGFGMREILLEQHLKCQTRLFSDHQQRDPVVMSLRALF